MTDRRFHTGMRGADSAEAGLVQEDDGTVWLVAPDGTRTQLGEDDGGGGDASFPDEWTVGENGSLAMAPSGPVVEGSSALTVRGAATLATLTLDAGDNSTIRFDALQVGDLITVTLSAGAVTGVTVNVTDSDIAILYEDGPTTTADVVAAVNGDVAASALVEATTIGSGSGPPPGVNYPTPLIGSNAYALDLHSNSDPSAEHGEYVLVWRDENGTIVGHLDNDGGGNFSYERIAFSEFGGVVIDNGQEPPGQPVLVLKNLGAQLLSIQTPGGGYGLVIGGFDASDVPLQVFAGSAQTADLFQLFDENGDVPKFRVGALGHPVTRVNAAPADATLAANECGMWFDSSNGAAKVMFKGKTADGTVVSGSLALT